MSVPPLPDVLPLPTISPGIGDGPTFPTRPFFPPGTTFPPFFRVIRSGCWMVNYEPTNSFTVKYDGTIRITTSPSGRTASGDLYQRPVFSLPNPWPVPVPPFPIPNPNPGPLLPVNPPVRPLAPIILPGFPPSPAAGIPILARNRYRAYLRITKIDEGLSFGNTFTLEIQIWRYTSTDKRTFKFTKDTNDYTVTMTWMAAPTGYPAGAQYAEGDLKDIQTGAVTGRFKMGWLSEFLRKSSIEIDTVAGSERPLNNGAGQDWASIFKTVGWDMKVKLSDTNIPEPSGSSWSTAELHQAMLNKRDTINLDREWAYYLLAVKDFDGGWFGIMFDSDFEAADSNNVAREGAAISSHTMLNDPRWGPENGKRYGQATAPYFRTAVHEIGHAFSLQHNTVMSDNSFMNTTVSILDKATVANPFDNLIKWMYADENLVQLRHWPDVFVRPGGVEFGLATNFNPPITPDDALPLSNLSLTIYPLLTEVPLGAPVRVDLTLTNTSQEPTYIPSDISLKSSFLSGSVLSSDGTSRTFRPFICYEKAEQFFILQPGKSISKSLTLLRGAQGSLFPSAGLFDISIQLSWTLPSAFDSPSLSGFISASTDIMITHPLTPTHASAAHKILSTPDTLLVLIMGGEYIKDGIEAIQVALGDKCLGPHFKAVEARRLAGLREKDLEGARKLVEGEVVASVGEKMKLERLGVLVE